MKQNLPGGLSAVVPPDPMPNSEVKRRSADGSVGSPHARVGNCQASKLANGKTSHAMHDTFRELHQQIRCNADEQAAQAVLELAQ